MKITFLLKRSKLLKNGEAPIYLRLTINGQREELSIKRSISPQQWNPDRSCARGSSRNSMELNTALDDIRLSINNIIRNLEANEAYIDSKSVVKILQNKVENYTSLVSYFQKHNTDIRNQIGNGYRPSTVKKYEITLEILKTFLQLKYEQKDIGLRQIDLIFLKDFHLYLKVDRKNSPNTSAKYLKLLRKIIKMAVDEGQIIRDPFTKFKAETQEVIKDPLTVDEVSRIISKSFEIDRLNKVKEMFIMACFTGLSFSDTADLSKEHLVQDEEGVFWLKKKRVKTNQPFAVPLLSVPLEIINKYKSHPCFLIKGKLLPVPANSNFNSTLKDIAAACGITKNITTHTARHTFATIAHESGIPLEVIAKILGHSNTKMTLRYAKTPDSMLKSAMFGQNNILNQHLNNVVKTPVECD